MTDGEDEIRAACDAHDYDAAATLVIEQYGRLVLAFLRSRLRNHARADDVMGMVGEKLWRGIPNFDWRCSIKGWLYRIARNAANDYVLNANNRFSRNMDLDDYPSISGVMLAVRTATHDYLRTEPRDRLRELREQLPLDDQMLLVLRIDQEMSWLELAAAMADGTEPLDDTALKRESVRLRKSFERVKDQIKVLALERGLL